MTAPHPAGKDLRLLRAAVFAAVCVVLAGAGHSLASCAGVPAWTLGAGFLGVIAVAAPLAGRERSLPGIVALLAAGQTVLHALFGLGQHGSTPAAATAAGTEADATLVQQAAKLLCGTTAAAISPARAQRILTDARLAPRTHTHHPADAAASGGDGLGSLLPSLPMLLGHLLAAVATGWLLRRGDLALARLVELSAHSAHTVAEGALVRALRAALALVRVLCAGLPDAAGAVARLPRTGPLAPVRLRTTALQHSVIRRGPPAAALVLAA
ncbi:hypothetical protein [Streptomyces fumanus]|uniref:Integral membrane protein n=1 Tax=Streptomyces fumanus TaxID=67302 RepID=A0A919A9T2_9ACTN|nr:hypothetical protein [Streptomyces fumanus]GHE90830.1 hypothetical protein GCM10018772_13440 [Streptomyces fumanus]